MNIKKRQQLRYFAQTVSLLLFPVTLNYMSPYVIIDGAFGGIVSGSALVFTALLLSSPFLGRSWCSWVCPAGTIQDQLARSRGRAVSGKTADGIKYLIWAVWMGTIVFGFAQAGVRAIDPLHLTDTGISVDSPLRYITYFGVIAIFVAIAMAVGRRAACHTICWMAPFMIFGRKAGIALGLPGIRLMARAERCTSCGSCTRVCPMSLDIGALARKGLPEHPECIQCGLCVETCPGKVLSIGFSRPGAR